MSPGDSREFVVLREDQRSGELQLSIRRAEEALVWRRLRQSLEEGAAVEGLVTSFNAAGLMVDVQGQKGFVPGSHVPNNVSPEDLVGRRLALKLLEVDEERQRLVLSNRRRASSSGGRTFRVGESLMLLLVVVEFFFSPLEKRQKKTHFFSSLSLIFEKKKSAIKTTQATSSSARSRPSRSTEPSSTSAGASTVSIKLEEKDFPCSSFFFFSFFLSRSEKRNGKKKLTPFSPFLSRLFLSSSQHQQQKNIIKTGLLHVSQISHDHVATIDKVLAPGDKIKVLVLTHDRERGRISLSTKKLEPTPGDMLRNPAAVFERADEMAAQFRALMKEAEAAAREGEGAGAGAAAPAE